MNIERIPSYDECLDVMWRAVASYCRGEISMDEVYEQICDFIFSALGEAQCLPEHCEVIKREET